MSDSSSGSREQSVSVNNSYLSSFPQSESRDNRPTSSTDSGRSDHDRREIPRQVGKWSTAVELKIVANKFLITPGTQNMDIRECICMAPTDRVLHPHVTETLEFVERYLGSQYIDFEFNDWRKSDSCELYSHRRLAIRDKINACEELLFMADILTDAKIG